MLEFTQQQLAILDAVGKMTTVSAGAGTGKTRVLVERYVKIVQRSKDGSLPPDLRAGVKEILTLTFTEAATTEMKRRLVERLTALGMPDERREVETAYISTIHGFCRRLLKENPFEAGLDPQFSDLGQGESALLLESAYEKVIDAGFEAGWPDVIGLFRAFGTARRFGDMSIDPLNLLRREAIAVCDAVRSRGWSQQRLLKWLDEGPDAILNASTKIVVAHLNQIGAGAAALIDGMDRLSLGVECEMDETRRRLLAMREALCPLPEDASAAACAEWCSDVWPMRALAGKRKPKKGADPILVQELKERLTALCGILDDEKKLLTGFQAQFEEESARQAHWLLRLSLRLWEQYDELKRAEARLDFNDLQAKARDLLLESPAVRERYRRRLRHLMVDEFQDTDALQSEILHLLKGDRNLFCVGDAKQSIYGFRNADVTIFSRLSQQTQAGDPAIHAHLALQQNFRCRPEIIELVNHLFAQIGCGAGIEYEHLESHGVYKAREEPSLELLLAPSDTDPDKAAAPEKGAERKADSAEAELVARRIREMIDSQTIRITAVGDHLGKRRLGEPLKYRDFMILLRTTTPLDAYERALERHRVDYYIVGGRGYYALREIRDVANLLKVIQNPLDGVALASLLRSPFCGLSDEALYLLAQGGRYERSLHAGVAAAIEDEGRRTEDGGRRTEDGGRRTEDEVTSHVHPQAHAAIPAADLLRLRRFWELIERLRRKEDRTPVASLLEEALSETLYEARLLLEANGRRKMANVRKLVVSASRQEGCGIAEFLHSLSQLSRVQEKEGEAPTEEEAANVVRVRTIHSAKGLESEVVILGGLSRSVLSPANLRPAFLFDYANGAGGCQYPAPGSGKSQASAAYSALRKQQEQKEIDESLRLLYVAMTRAREFLILAGSFPPRGETWAGRLLPCLGVTAPPTKDQGDQVIQIVAGVSMVVKSQVPGSAREPTVTRKILHELQRQMRSGQPLDPNELANLRNLSRVSRLKDEG